MAIFLGAIYFGFGYLKNQSSAKDFFNKYNVLTVVGDESTFSYKEIELNGEVIDQTEDEWTNVLPIPNTLKYVSAISSYVEGREIKCGAGSIPKRVEVVNFGENEWCIRHNGEEIISTTAPQYFHYDDDEIVYEKCLKGGYYQGVDGTISHNSCAERALFLNDKRIATTLETMGVNRLNKEPILEDASSFNYHPSKKVGNSIIYTTTEGSFAYDISSGETKPLSDPTLIRIDDVFLTDNGETIVVTEENKLYENAFFGYIEHGGQVFTNVYSAEYVDGHFYILRIVDVENTSLISVMTYELIRDGRKIENLEVDGISPHGYDATAIQAFPLCDFYTIVCVYEDGHYAYKNRSLMPDVFGYDFYTEEMVIDGEWRGDNIPNLIGRSKPIFENGKLKYLVHLDILSGQGLYLVDFDKKWSFKSIYFQRKPSTTKLLGGYQNILLNVMK